MLNKDRLDSLLTIVLVLCAVMVTGMIAYRQFSPPPDPNAPPRPKEVKNWKQFAVGAKRIGRDDSPVTIIEFSDFQCPFCKRLASELVPIRQQHGSDVEIVFRNFPLQQLHPYARSAALAAECAALDGNFVAYHDFVFAHQDSLGTLSWGQVAERAGIADTAAFIVCTQGNRAAQALNADTLAGEQLGVTGTPTFLVNRWLVSGVPTPAVLDSLILSELARATRQ